MSSFIYKNERGETIKEIMDIVECKWKINDICCNDQCEFLADYPYPYHNCESKQDCKYFEKED